MITNDARADGERAGPGRHPDLHGGRRPASASYVAPTVDGSHTVVVTDTDTAGNRKTASFTFTLDTTISAADGCADRRQRQLAERPDHQRRAR